MWRSVFLIYNVYLSNQLKYLWVGTRTPSCFPSLSVLQTIPLNIPLSLCMSQEGLVIEVLHLKWGERQIFIQVRCKWQAGTLYITMNCAFFFFLYFKRIQQSLTWKLECTFKVVWEDLWKNKLTRFILKHVKIILDIYITQMLSCSC